MVVGDVVDGCFFFGMFLFFFTLHRLALGAEGVESSLGGETPESLSSPFEGEKGGSLGFGEFG